MKKSLLIITMALVPFIVNATEKDNSELADFSQQAKASISNLNANTKINSMVNGKDKVNVSIEPFTLPSITQAYSAHYDNWVGKKTLMTGTMGYISLAFEVDFLVRRNPYINDTAAIRGVEDLVPVGSISDGKKPTSVTIIMKEASTGKVVLNKTETLKYSISMDDSDAPLNVFLTVGDYKTGLKPFFKYNVECYFFINSNYKGDRGRLSESDVVANSAILTVVNA